MKITKKKIKESKIKGNKLIKEIYLTNPVKYQNKNMKITNKIKNKIK